MSERSDLGSAVSAAFADTTATGVSTPIGLDGDRSATEGDNLRVDAGGKRPPARVSAVAIIVDTSPAGPRLLLTLRSRTIAHAWRVAFPGGMAEPGDRTSVDTAIREAREETGIELSPRDHAGTLQPIEAPQPADARSARLLIVPEIFVPRSDPFPNGSRLQADEVEELFWVDTQRLATAGMIDHPLARSNGQRGNLSLWIIDSGDVARRDGRSASVLPERRYAIWGITGRLLWSFFARFTSESPLAPSPPVRQIADQVRWLTATGNRAPARRPVPSVGGADTTIPLPARTLQVKLGDEDVYCY